MSQTSAAGPATYPPDWKAIAQRIKDQAGWSCERCKEPHRREGAFVLTVHHLDGNKANCADWNLAALCQRCHLKIQARVTMDQLFFADILDVSEWFKPHLEGYLRSKTPTKLTDPRRQRTLSVRKPMNDQETLSVERGADSVQRPCSASLSSPALKHQSEIYPPRYRGRVPWKIKMACTVRPDLEWLCKTRGTVAVMDEVYECWVNMHGAVAAICRNGEMLGIKPAEFDVVEWHTQTPNDPSSGTAADGNA